MSFGQRKHIYKTTSIFERKMFHQKEKHTVDRKILKRRFIGISLSKLV